MTEGVPAAPRPREVGDECGGRVMFGGQERKEWKEFIDDEIKAFSKSLDQARRRNPRRPA